MKTEKFWIEKDGFLCWEEDGIPFARPPVEQEAYFWNRIKELESVHAEWLKVHDMEISKLAAENKLLKEFFYYAETLLSPENSTKRIDEFDDYGILKDLAEKIGRMKK